MTRAGAGAQATSPASPAPTASPTFATLVIRWQRQHGRHGLPWQGTRDPYRVWLSEVMLQQTQVSTVLEYYARFLQRFADVQALVADHGGEFPRSSAALAKLPGIGRSTAAAIAAFCFGERVAILDGNVKRVLGRTLGFPQDLATAPAVARLWSLADGLLPPRDVAVYTQGLMDMGATL